jgi:serine/threonine-protein kinase HipA
MRQAIVKVHGIEAGILTETTDKHFRFEYHEGYTGAPVSLTMPTSSGGVFQYAHFPPFFDGVLPEGGQLEGLLRIRKMERYDYFSQLIAVGEDLVGAVTVFEL